jgi:Carbamoyl-phosphate synthase L chain, ATP binding domain
MRSTGTSALLLDVETSPHFSYAKSLVNAGERLHTTSRVVKQLSLGPNHTHAKVDSENTEAVKQFIHSLLDRNDGSINIIAGTDRHLKLAWDLQASNGEAVHVCSPARSTVELLSSKTAARNLFELVGLPLAPGRVICDFSDAIYVAEAVGFPVVVKRRRSESSMGVGLARDKSELEILIRKAELLGETEVVVEASLGRTPEISFQFCIDGNHCLPIYALEKLGHLQPSYSTYLRMLPEDELDSISRILHTAPSFLTRGIYSAQFKQTKAGELALVEISPRFGNNFRIVNRMLPQLTRHIYEFYSLGSEWRFEGGRLKNSMLGISPVDYFLGNLVSHRIAGLSRLKSLSMAIRETTHHSVGAVFDDYFASSISHPIVFARHVVGVARLAKHITASPPSLLTILESTI